MRCCHTERLRKWNCSRYMYGVNLSDVTFAITITQNERCLYGPTLIKRAKTRKHCGRMPTTHLLTVHASYWTSLNMFGGFLYSAFQVEKKFEYVLGVGGGATPGPCIVRTPCGQNDRQIDMTENITFLQLCWCAVTITVVLPILLFTVWNAV